MGFTWIEKGIEPIDGFLTNWEYECDAEVNERKYYKRQTAALWSSSAICGGLLFSRQAGRSDKGNYLESGEIRGNMLTQRFAFPLYRTNGEKL